MTTQATQGELFTDAAGPTVAEILAAARRRKKSGRGAPTSHRCPAPTCPIYVPMRRLACSDHWFGLPEPLRKAINDTYRRDRRQHLAHYREAIRLLHSSTREDHPNS